MKKFRELSEQHREKGRFKPTIPHNVSSTPGGTPRNTSDSANVRLREEVELDEAHTMVCKDCGDKFGKPTNKTCPHDSHNPKGSNWVEKIDEALRHEIAGQVARFIGNKIDPVHGDIMHAHGKEAYRQAAYHIRGTIHHVSKAISDLHDKLHHHLRTGNPIKIGEEVEELEEAINHLQMAKHHQALAKEHDRISHKAAKSDEDELANAHGYQSDDHQAAAKAHLQAHKTGNPKDIAAAKKATRQSLQTGSVPGGSIYHVSKYGDYAHKDYNYTKLRSGADAVKKGLKEEVEELDEISLKDRLAGKTAPVIKSKYNRTKANRPMTGKELERHNRSKQLDFEKMPKPDHAKDYTLKHRSSNRVKGELGDATNHNYDILHKGKKVGEHHFAGYFGHGTTTIHGHEESDTGYIGSTERLHHYMKTKKGHTNVFGKKEGEAKHADYVAKHGVKKYPELSEEIEELDEGKYGSFRVRMTSGTFGGPKLPRRGYGYVPQGDTDPRTGLPLGFSHPPKKDEPKKVKEDVEQIDEISAEKASAVARARDLAFRKNKPTATQQRKMAKGYWRGLPDVNANAAYLSAIKRGADDPYQYGKKKKANEEVESLEEKNVPTSPEKWAQAKAQAKAKFDVYPSAYANGWAAKKYKEMGGGWKSVSEDVELEEGYFKNQEIEKQETERLAKRNEPPFTPDKPKKKSVVVGKKPEGYSRARQLARQVMQKYVNPVKEAKEISKKAQIVKDTMKKTTDEDKFQAKPELGDSLTKNL